MEYSNLVSISGLSGLFEMVASKTDGAIVKSLEDQTTNNERFNTFLNKIKK